jgi:hypothetical protein
MPKTVIANSFVISANSSAKGKSKKIRKKKKSMNKFVDYEKKVERLRNLWLVKSRDFPSFLLEWFPPLPASPFQYFFV